MKTNGLIRSAASASLKNNWGTGVLVALVVTLATCISTTIPAVNIALWVFLFCPLYVGISKMFLELARDGQPLGFEGIFGVFNSELYMKCVCVELLSTVYTLLWTLLFIIPGIVKMCSYAMSHYIMLENPTLSADECIERSMQMMDGHKWDFFLILLGYFILMVLASIFTLGIGCLWISTYYEAIFAHFYLALKEEIKN